MTLQRVLLFTLLWLFTTFLVVEAQNVITVYPQVNHVALKNPLKGFRPDPNGLSNGKYGTIVRDYITWSDIEKDSTDGVEKIIDFCNVRWKDYEKNNIKVIPRVYILWDEHSIGNWPSDLTEGDWTSQKFKDRVVNLIYKLGLAWDNDPRVAWVQTGLIGWWGEQESPVGVHQDEWAKRLGEAYTKAFKNKKLLVRNQSVWDMEGYELGVYWDSFAHPQQANVHTDIKNRNKQGRYLTQIIEGETAYNWGASAWNPKYGASPTATLNSNTYTNNLIDVIRDLHCTGLGWVANYKIDGSEGSTIETVKTNASKMQKAFGYNFVITEFSCLQRADQGSSLALNFKVKNDGSAPFYENWPLAFVLIEETTREIVWKEHLSSESVRNWLPGDNYNYTTRTYQIPATEYTIEATITVPDSILTGQYMAGLAILEPYSQTPGIFFDLQNFISKSQTQPLCRIGIGEDLVGGYEVNPALLSDPIANDTRSYSLTPRGFGYNLNTNSTNGTIILHPAGGKYLPGTVVTIIAKSDFGYKFTSWDGDLSGSDKVTTINMDGDKSISANFEAVPTYELQTSATNGSIVIKPIASVFEEGTNVTIKANPDFGYQFSGWSGDLTGMDNPTSIIMDTDKSITATFTKLEGTIVFATNCGGQAFTSSDGVEYLADTKFSSGNNYSTNAAIAGTADGVLYRTERYGSNFTYNIPLPNGVYQVMLMFAEIYHSSANSRVFNITIEGSPVISNLDVWSEVGANTAYNEAHLVTLSDDVLDISFTGVKDFAKISAIKILQVSTFVSNLDIAFNNFPEHTKLLQIYPNPFSTKTTIHYQLHENTPVKLHVFNSLGEHISTIVNEFQSAGNYSVDWNAHDGKRGQLANGLYIFKLDTGNKSVQTIQSVLLR